MLIILKIGLCAAFTKKFIKTYKVTPDNSKRDGDTILDWLQVNSTSRTAFNVLRCDFCLSFWICLLFSILFFIFTGVTLEALIWPLAATPIAYYFR